jgi:hypothetical protein
MSETLTKTFEFGPGTSQSRSHMRTFAVPAHSIVSIAVRDMALDPPGGTVPVLIEVRQATAASISNTGPDGPLLAVGFADAPSGVFAFQNQSFTSSFGCPSTWRVRVRVAEAAPTAKVSGTIVFVFNPPGVLPIEMTGADTQHLDPNATASRLLRGRLGSVPSSIAGTGQFRIMAKWHTDPADLLHLGSHHPLKVELLRPNGTVGNDEIGFSQHAADKTPKVNFTYTVTAQDATMAGVWGVRITNNSPVRIVDFDLDRGFDPNPGMPNFKSTFQARCS